MIPARLTRSVLRFLAPCLAFLACLGTPPSVHSATPEEAGLKIALEARARGKGFGNFTARQIMLLRNKQGQESRRQLRAKNSRGRRRRRQEHVRVR